MACAVPCGVCIAWLKISRETIFELHFGSVNAGLVYTPDTLHGTAFVVPVFIFMCSSGRRFETGLALLNRCRAHCAVTPDLPLPQLLATPCPHGHLDIAGPMNFPTGRLFRHVCTLGYPLDDSAQNRTSTTHQLQPLRHREGLLL